MGTRTENVGMGEVWIQVERDCAVFDDFCPFFVFVKQCLSSIDMASSVHQETRWSHFKYLLAEFQYLIHFFLFDCIIYGIHLAL